MLALSKYAWPMLISHCRVSDWCIKFVNGADVHVATEGMIKVLAMVVKTAGLHANRTHPSSNNIMCVCAHKFICN